MDRMTESRQRTIAIIGNGMVGHRFCELMTELDTEKRFQLTVIGEEPRVAYDRVHLTQYLATRDAQALALGTADWYSDRGITLRTHERVIEMDPLSRTLRTDRGAKINYDIAVLATGSRPFVPDIAGIEQRGVFVYRTIEDLDAIADAASNARQAAVIGGGLLGLEAAKALLDLGLPTSILEVAPRLMPRQLDEGASRFLRERILQLGVAVHTGVRLKSLLGQGSVQGIELHDGAALEADLVVVSAGIRPRDDLARQAHIPCHGRGGVLVDDGLKTDVEGIYAIGECACHRDTVYGLVGPGYAMAQTLARRLTGDLSAEFTGADTSTKLKLLGIDVASIGNPFADEQTSRSVVLQSYASGVYQKLTLSDDGSQLIGGILVGDAEPFNRVAGLVRSGKHPGDRPETLLLPAATSLTSNTECGDDLICTCNTVARDDIVRAVVEGGCTTFGEVKKATRAGTGCGGCANGVTDIVHQQLAKLGKATKKRLCEHFDFTRQELFEIVRIKGYTQFEQLLSSHGQGTGCEVCKPAVASILASIHNDFILEHSSLQDTNDRFLANIQKRGLYSVVPRIPGGEITPARLRTIAEVAQKYGLYTKITGGQRIDLFGATLSQLPLIWEELIAAGFESGHAYGKAVRTVKSCVGSTWCRFGVNDSVSFAIRIENRYKGIRAPHKLKSAVSGCIRECAEAQSKDFGYIATEAGWNLYVCGNGGSQPRHAELLVAGVDDETAIKLTDRFLMYYIRTADKLTRTAKWVDQLEGGIAHLREVIINDSLGICADLERDMEHLISTYRCEWAEAIKNPEVRGRFREYANDQDEAPSLVPVRGQTQPEDWPKRDTQPTRRSLPVLHRTWTRLARVEEVPLDTGLTFRVGRAQIALFRVSPDGSWYATQARCPHRGDAVLGRGLVGDSAGEPKVACPFHKRTFSLRTGTCTSGEGTDILTFPVRVADGMVEVELPEVAQLEAILCDADNSCEASSSSLSPAAE